MTCYQLIFREDANKKRERREKLRQWQEKMNREKSSELRNQQLGNKGRGKKKLSKPTKDDKRRSGLESMKSDDNQKDRDPHRRTMNSAIFESDDYFEIPMDVESDSTGDCKCSDFVYLYNPIVY